MILDADAGQAIRTQPADLPLIVQEQLELVAERHDAGASEAEVVELVDELVRPRDWRSR